MPSEPSKPSRRRAPLVVGSLVALTLLLNTISGDAGITHVVRRIDQRATSSGCLADLQARNSADIDAIVRLALIKAPAADYVTPLADLAKVEDQLRHLGKTCPQ